MVQKTNNAVATQTDPSNNIIPFGSTPSYLQDTESTGMEGLDTSDYKVPRIKLLQPLNPEVRSFAGVAIPGMFWHTGANISLGSEFTFIPCIASKRVILWNPRESGGGMLAFSRDGVKWTSGGNSSYTVKIDKGKKTVTWTTGADVKSSRLSEWGSYDPEDPRSPPAAQTHYEYMCYLPGNPELSPVVMGVSRTGAVNAKQFNTQMLMLRKPIQSMMVRCFADEEHKGSDVWHNPNFSMLGFAPENLYTIARDIGDKQKDYVAEYDNESSTSTTSASHEDY